MNLDEIEGQIRGFKTITDNLHKEIEKIESSNRELTKKIKNIEIQGLQEQITSISQSLLETNRYLANIDIAYLRVFLLKWLANVPSKEIEPKLFLRAIDFVKDHAISSQERAKLSQTPLDVSENYTKECKEFFKNNELHAFTE